MKIKTGFAILLFHFYFILTVAFAQNTDIDKVNTFLANFKKHDTQPVLSNHVENKIFNVGLANFKLISGEATVFDFGLEKNSAMIFRGQAEIDYAPDDINEQYQLDKFTGKKNFIRELDSLCVFFSDESCLDMDFSQLSDIDLDEDIWEKLKSAEEHAFSHLGIFMPNKLLGNLLFSDKIPYFYADMYVKTWGVLRSSLILIMMIRMFYMSL